MARLIDGKAAALALRIEVARAVEGFVAEQGRRPGLAVVIVGDHPASRAYVRTKTRMAEAAGIEGFQSMKKAELVAALESAKGA